MHANLEPVSFTSLSGGGTLAALHLLSVHELHTADGVRSTLRFELRDDAGAVLASSLDTFDAPVSVDDSAALAQLCARLGLTVLDVVTEPAAERTSETVEAEPA